MPVLQCKASSAPSPCQWRARYRTHSGQETKRSSVHSFSVIYRQSAVIEDRYNERCHVHFGLQFHIAEWCSIWHVFCSSVYQNMCTSLLSSRLLTLWFDYGHLLEVHDALVEGIKTIDIDTWLQVRAIFRPRPRPQGRFLHMRSFRGIS